MAVAIMKSQLRSFIQSMYDEGIVNSQFYQLQSMKEATGRDYVVRAVTRYCISCHNLFRTLTDKIYQQNVDFQMVHVLARELYARSSGVGAENVRRACAELLHACEREDKNYCFQALYWTKNEFSYLRRKLETLVQNTPPGYTHTERKKGGRRGSMTVNYSLKMERRIIDLGNMQ